MWLLLIIGTALLEYFESACSVHFAMRNLLAELLIRNFSCRLTNLECTVYIKTWLFVGWRIGKTSTASRGGRQSWWRIWICFAILFSLMWKTTVSLDWRMFTTYMYMWLLRLFINLCMKILLCITLSAQIIQRFVLIHVQRKDWKRMIYRIIFLSALMKLCCVLLMRWPLWGKDQVLVLAATYWG